MASCIKFDLDQIFRRASHVVSRWAVLYPVTGFCRDDHAITEAVKKLQRYWRARVYALIDADYDPRPNKDQLLARYYARNCRPAFVYAEPQTASCGWPICPFCCARNVVRYWPRLRRSLPPCDIKDYPYSLVERRSIRSFPRKTFEADRITASLIEAVAERSRFMNSRAHRRLPGMIWHTLVDLHDANYDIVTRQLFLLHAGDSLPAGFDSGQLRRHERPNGREVMRIAARLFRYPKSWLHGDLDAMLALLRARKSRKLLTFTGVFHDHFGTNSDDPESQEPALQTELEEQRAQLDA